MMLSLFCAVVAVILSAAGGVHAAEPGSARSPKVDFSFADARLDEGESRHITAQAPDVIRQFTDYRSGARVETVVWRGDGSGLAREGTPKERAGQ